LQVVYGFIGGTSVLLREGRKGNCPQVLFSGGYRQHRELEEFFTQAVTGGTGVNGLRRAKTKHVKNKS